ncbi:MAG: hypothetical protein KF745_14585 [Phycisphaeraceae bacterium]|nr:hypothetical protein [Phycisphaeraceae bacterium]
MSTRPFDYRQQGFRPLVLEPTCPHLRHKMMYCDERQSTPGLVDDTSDTRVFFCIKSMDQFGPDGQPVRPRSCQGGRSCYGGSPASPGEQGLGTTDLTVS